MTPQPISTAPKGTRILVYCQRGTLGEGWWEIGQFYGQEGRWMNDEDEPKLGITQPTCWLPLPPLPVTEESSTKDEEYDEDEHRRL